jgi:hypothetical protein
MDMDEPFQISTSTNRGGYAMGKVDQTRQRPADECTGGWTQRRYGVAVLVAAAGLLCVVGIASAVSVVAKFPAKAKAKIQAVVDETGNVLFGSASPGKVEVTNFPPAGSQVEVTNLAASPTPLAPKKASDLQTLVAFLTSGACADDGFAGWVSRAFDGAIRAGGGGVFDSFSVPVGQVFVVTSLDWLVEGAPASRVLFVRFRPATVTGFNVAAAVDTALSDASGTAGGSLNLGSGVTIRSGEQFCVSLPFSVTNIEAAARGFLVSDS